MQHYNIIKNKLKVTWVRKNALAYQTIVKDHGSLDAYLWSFVDGKQIVNHPDVYKNLPASTEISEKLSKSLKKYGFTFVGPTICYAFMQAAWLVNDHEVVCKYR